MLPGIVILTLRKRGILAAAPRVLTGVTLIVIGMCALGVSAGDEVGSAVYPTVENFGATVLTDSDEPHNAEEAEPSASEWTLSNDVDDFDGKVSWFAISPEVGPDTKMSFLDEDTKSHLFYACSNGPQGFSEGALLLFSNTFLLDNEEFDFDSGARLVKSRVKWDDTLETVKLRVVSGQDVLRFRDSEQAINAIKSHNTLRIELHWVGSGRVLFTYSLNGAKKTIEQAHANCLAKKSEGP